MRKKTNDLLWLDRIKIYCIFFVLGSIAVYWGTVPIVNWLSNLYPTASRTKYTIAPFIPLALFLFGFVLSLGTWIIRTSDTIKQFEDSLQVRNDTLFIEAVRLLFEGQVVQSRAQGLLQIVNLRKSGAIDREQLDRITMSKIKLKDALLGYADLTDVSLRGADLEKAYLGCANLTAAHLGDTNFKNAILVDAILVDAILKRANLEGANLGGANLEAANLEGTNLEGANLEGAHFESANLKAANLEGANLEAAQYNKDTKFPINFSPTDAKMVKVV